MELNLGILASNRGTNVKDILNEIKGRRLEASVRVIISNKSNAPVLALAQEEKIPSYFVKSDDKRIAFLFEEHKVNLVVLCGYLVPVGREILEVFKNRVINIHPALLPAYGGKGMYGMNVHLAVLRSSDKESGATVYIVDDKYDHGKVIGQIRVPRFEDDRVDTLFQRVRDAEQLLYPRVIRDIQTGEINLDE